jgi:hypothetical protein
MTMFDASLGALARGGVEFMVVGGLAVAEAGFNRLTEDLDVLVEASPANLARLLAVMRARVEGADALTPEDLPLEEGAVRFVEDVVLDVFTQMSGHTYADLLPYTFLKSMQGTPVRYLNAEGLIRLKQDSLRPKDRIDVETLRDLLRTRKDTR